MPSIVPTTVLVCAFALASGCATHGGKMTTVVKATPAQQAALLDQIKSLEGEWTSTDEQGKTVTSSVFKVSSAGTAVREIMFPGSSHEMTNLYHMDGPTLLLTHYCAAGNQPHLRARAGAKPGWINFDTDSVSNWSGGNELYMGRMHLEIKDADHIVQHWAHIEGSKVTEGLDIEMTRKK
ncbi:MAG: hypothetical protein IT438_04435 [Phycisphaerales bacterium]|nr:hypothetical protein [Phycisphaerales bacterium]